MILAAAAYAEASAANTYDRVPGAVLRPFWSGFRGRNPVIHTRVSTPERNCIGRPEQNTSRAEVEG